MNMNPINEPNLEDTGDKDIKYKSLCVTQRRGKFFYPKTIPRVRSNVATEFCVLICIILFVADTITNNLQFNKLLLLYCIGYIVMFCLQVIYRLILLTEEFSHLISRYQNSYTNLFKSISKFSTIYIISLLISLHYVIVSYTSFTYAVDINFILCFLPVMYFLEKILNLNACLLNDSLMISKINGLDYGSGLAYSFFYGYLNLVLPKSGEENKNLAELMEDYEGTHRIKFQVHKLFILIPISCHCFPSLKTDNSPSIDESESLPQKNITRAGVQNRPYKNSVYKITEKNKSKKVYVCAEYATPLKTFKEVLDNAGQHNEHYNRHKQEISLQFYLTLKTILKNTSLDAFCEIIYFEDSYLDEDGQSTKYYDVGNILLSRLRELKNVKKND